MVNKFDDYMLDIIVESIGNKESPLLLSSSMKKLLNKIDHPISKKLLFDEYSKEEIFKMTYVDIDLSGKDMVSFILVPKAAEIINKSYYNRENYQIPYWQYSSSNHEDSMVYSRNRVVTTIGRFINKLYPNMFIASGKPGEDIESFTTLFKTYRTTVANFELVNGDKISYWYHEENYSEDADDDTTLGNSCMKDEECQYYIEFYDMNKNNVSLLILKDPNDDSKIIGRALVWNLTEPKNRKFMDRIYTVMYEDIQLFKNYAIEKGWLYKKKQSYSDPEIIDPTNKEKENVVMVVRNMIPHEKYPYMDTMKYYNSVEMVISNSEFYVSNVNTLPDGDPINVNCLDDSWGGPETLYLNGTYYIKDDLIECDYSNDESYELPDNAVYLPYYSSYASKEFFEENVAKCKYHNSEDDEYIIDDDATYLEHYNEYMSPDYDWERLFVEDIDGQLIKKKDAVPSKYHGDYIYINNAVKVQLSKTNVKLTDWRVKNDGTYYKTGGVVYDIELKNKK